jgi:hypothetical protein
MRIKQLVLASMGLVAASWINSSEAFAQSTVDPIVARDGDWATVTQVSTIIGASTVFLMPRIYYSDPESTVGWKGRWHFSHFAPMMTMAAATFLVDGPIKNELKLVRPGCAGVDPAVAGPGSNCETYGGPSTLAFASWGAFGVGTGIFLIDTLKYSKGRFNAGSFIGNVGVPLVAGVLTSVGRSIDGVGQPFETQGQVLAGTFIGMGSGLLVGIAYSLLQRPSCGYGNAVFCW